jgi:hypothetical protein
MKGLCFVLSLWKHFTMDPITMMMLGNAIGGGVPALAQAGLGVYQGIKANKMQKDLKDPVYEVPDAIDQSIAMYADRANTNTMVGYDNAVQKLDQGMANTTNDILTAAGSGGDALGALVKANAGNQNAMNDLAIQNAKAVDSYDTDLIRAVAGRAAYEDKAFQVNVMDKFNRDSAAVSAMKNAAINNVFGGIKSGAKVAGDTMGMSAANDLGLYGQQKAATTDNISGEVIGAAGVPQKIGLQYGGAKVGGIAETSTPETIQALKDALLYDLIGGDVSMKPSYR